MDLLVLTGLTVFQSLCGLTWSTCRVIIILIFFSEKKKKTSPGCTVLHKLLLSIYLCIEADAKQLPKRNIGPILPVSKLLWLSVLQKYWLASSFLKWTLIKILTKWILKVWVSAVYEHLSSQQSLLRIPGSAERSGTLSGGLEIFPFVLCRSAQMQEMRARARLAFASHLTHCLH